MARAAMKYVFAAMLAFLSTQAVVPCPRILAAIEIVCRTGAEAEQRTPREPGRIPAVRHRPPAAPAYASRTRPEPDAAALFQRPPPVTSLVA